LLLEEKMRSAKQRGQGAPVDSAARRRRGRLSTVMQQAADRPGSSRADTITHGINRDVVREFGGWRELRASFSRLSVMLCMWV
jgi:hypothetical protein